MATCPVVHAVRALMETRHADVQAVRTFPYVSQSQSTVTSPHSRDGWTLRGRRPADRLPAVRAARVIRSLQSAPVDCEWRHVTVTCPVDCERCCRVMALHSRPVGAAIMTLWWTCVCGTAGCTLPTSPDERRVWRHSLHQHTSRQALCLRRDCLTAVTQTICELNAKLKQRSGALTNCAHLLPSNTSNTQTHLVL